MRTILTDHPQPGELLRGVRVRVMPWTPETERAADQFDPVCLCHPLMVNGAAAILTDFRQDADGLTNILVLDRGLTPARAGALAQRLLEIETYRTLALLSLPLTRSMASDLRRMESRLATITGELCTRLENRRDSDVLLTELTGLAAELEAGVAANLYLRSSTVRCR